jgi:NADPH:quinone reductase-like Zn-dependent oxidoreductase
MEMMKAVSQKRYGGPDVLTIQDLPKPSPKDNELLIRVHAAPITAAGGFMREGKPYLGRLAIGIFKPKSQTPGVCFSGEVEDIGKDVKLFQVGDNVFGETLFNMGTQAAYVCAGEEEVIAKKPEHITHAEAAPICDGHLTSMNFLTQVTTLRPGQRILIIGASGSLGTAAVQIATELGAEVTGVCSTANIELVKSLGAHAVIDYTKTDFSKDSVTYDVIYDTVGKSSFNTCKPVLTEHGVYMSPVLDFKLLCQALWTSKLAKKKAKFSATGILPKQELKRMLFQIKALIEEQKIRTVMDRKYTFDQVSEAHSYADTGRKKGNVVLLVDH